MEREVEGSGERKEREGGRVDEEESRERDVEGVEGDGGRGEGEIGMIVPVKFGKIPHCCR